MPRRKIVDPEIEITEEELKPRRKLVEAEHTVRYTDLMPVPIEEPQEEEDFVLEEEDIQTQKQRKRKTAKTERDDLRKELSLTGVTPASKLKLSIDRYLHSEAADSGTLAEKEFCTKYACDKDHITTEDYLDVARRYGPGRYWFTLRMDNKIVTQWERRINTPPVQPSMVQNAIPGDPSSPQVVFQMPNQPAVTQIDPFKEAERGLNLVKKYNEVFGHFPNAEPKPSEEETIAGAIFKRPEVIDSVISSVMKKYTGGDNADDPSWASVAMEAVRSGQLTAAVQVAGNVLMNVINQFIPRANNGQAQMVPQTVQNQTPAGHFQQEHSLPGVQAGQANTGGIPGSVAGDVHQGADPEEEIINEIIWFVLQECQKQTDPDLVVRGVFKHLEEVIAIDDPFYYPKIVERVAQFAEIPTDVALKFVEQMPGGQAIVSLPHAKDWTATLQQLIKERKAEGEE